MEFTGETLSAEDVACGDDWARVRACRSPLRESVGAWDVPGSNPTVDVTRAGARPFHGRDGARERTRSCMGHTARGARH